MKWFIVVKYDEYFCKHWEGKVSLCLCIFLFFPTASENTRSKIQILHVMSWRHLAFSNYENYDHALLHVLMGRETNVVTRSEDEDAKKLNA